MSRKIFTLALGCLLAICVTKMTVAQFPNHALARALNATTVGNVHWLNNLEFTSEQEATVETPAQCPSTCSGSCCPASSCLTCPANKACCDQRDRLTILTCCHDCPQCAQACCEEPTGCSQLSVPFLTNFPITDGPGVDFHFSDSFSFETNLEIPKPSELDCSCYHCVSDCSARPVVIQTDKLSGEHGSMALMLHAALKSCQTEQEAIATINRAMEMVARQTKDQFKTEMTLLQLEHQKEISLVNGRLLQMQGQLETTLTLKQWLGPLYTNQNRALQQMQLLATDSAELNRTLGILEQTLKTESKKISANRVARQTSRDNILGRDRELASLRSQILQLETRLQKLSNGAVRAADHQQPLYHSGRGQLSPLPHQMNQYRRQNDRN